MTRTTTAAHSVWAMLVLGLVMGLAAAAVLALVVVAVSLALGGWLLVVITAGFGGSGVWAALGVAAGLLASLAAAAFLLRHLVPPVLHRIQSVWGFASRPGSTRMARALQMLGLVVGFVLGLTFAGWALPEPITASALQFVTGQTAQQRAQQPAAQARQQRLKAVLAAHPNGPEAALIAAVDTVAEPVPTPGRQLTDRDLQARIGAIRRLLPTLPPGWAPVALGTLAQLQRGHVAGHQARSTLSPASPATRATPASSASSASSATPDSPEIQALTEAGRAGSHAFRVLAAQEQEAIAHQHERNGAHSLADAAWQRALEGYAAAGAGFEVARLYDETLPTRLLAVPVPPQAAAPAVDAVLSQRLWQFAQALGDSGAEATAQPGQRDLAAVAALIALERAPAGELPQASPDPAQGFAATPWAMGRWLLALRHARGDCLAALALSDSTRQRRRPAVVNMQQPAASALDMAWAVAWAEAGQACARTDEERAGARDTQARLEYLTFTPGLLDTARAGVAASVATLR